jgi:hypothetical protein
MTFTTANQDEKTKLMNRILQLRQQIRDTTDPVAIALIREDYRAAEIEYSKFYNDGEGAEL